MIWSLVVAVLILGVIYVIVEIKPSNLGPWKDEHERLASVKRDGDVVDISNLRRARYGENAKLEELVWEKKQVRLSNLKDVWFGLSVFQEPGLAHTMLSFDFGDGDPLVISVESRQRPGQNYNPLLGLLHQYHLIYVVGDERDILGVRTYSLGNSLHFQPLMLSEERMRTLFLGMVGRLNDLNKTPRFYNTLTSNCTTSLLKDTVVPLWQKILDPRLLLPGYSDRVAYEYEILDHRHACDDLRWASNLDDSDLDPEAKSFSDDLRSSFHKRIALVSDGAKT